MYVKALVGAFNQEKAPVGAFSVIVKTGCGTDGTLHSTNHELGRRVTENESAGQQEHASRWTRGGIIIAR